jgi:cytosine permease
VVGIMAVGGGMAAGMNWPELMAAVVLGNVILGLLAALSGYVGAQYGKSFAQLCGGVFPGPSGKIVLMYAPVTLIGWYSIECAIFGSLVGRILNLDPMMSRIAMAASAGVFCITTYLGIRGLQWISFVLVPAIVILGGYAFIYIMATGSGTFGFGSTPLSFDEGLGLVIGSWALGVVAAYPDLARFARSPRAGAWMGFLGILVFNTLNFLIGAAGAALAKEYDPALILLAAGVPTLAFIMAVGNVWTTNDANLYSASLGIARAFPISRRNAVLISALISVGLAYCNPAQFTLFFKFLGILGTTAPALGGVVLGGYFLTRGGQRIGSPSLGGRDGSPDPLLVFLRRESVWSRHIGNSLVQGHG